MVILRITRKHLIGNKFIRAVAKFVIDRIEEVFAPEGSLQAVPLPFQFSFEQQFYSSGFPVGDQVKAQLFFLVAKMW